MRHHAKAEQQGEGEEGREADEFAHSPELPFSIALQINEYRLRHCLHHTLQEVEALVVPLVSLVVVSCIFGFKESSEQDIEDLVVHLCEDGREHDLTAEGEHTLDGLRIKVPSRSPVGIMPVHQGDDQYIDDALCGQRPIGETFPGHHSTDNVRNDDGGHTALCLLLGAQVLVEVGRLRQSEAGEHEAQEDITTKRGECGLVIIAGDERCTEEQDDINAEAHGDIEPEHRVIVIVGRMLHVG